MTKYFLALVLMCYTSISFCQTVAITHAEYFVDTDPGPGNGIPLTFPATDSIHQDLAIPTTGLNSGVHQLYLRYATNSGMWGQTSSTSFIVTHPDKLAIGEYFIDTDPGVGMAIPMPAFSENDSIALSLSIPLDTLSPGTHMLYSRFRNTYGQWGQVASDTFTICGTAGTITGASTLCTGSNITLSDTASGGIWTCSDTAIATVNSSGIVTGITEGTAIVSYAIGNSCGTSIATKVITVNSTINPGTISGATAICEGSSIVLADTVTGGSWSSSNTSIASVESSGLVNGLAAGSAIISYNVTNVCGTSFSTKSVTVNALPFAGVVTGPGTVFSGATIHLTSTGITGGVWTSSDTAMATVNSDGYVTAISAGAVSISYTVTNEGCGAISAIKSVNIAATFSPCPAQPGEIAVTGGNGTTGFCGDGIPATASCLNNPFEAFADNYGNIYIADRGNQRIRKINSSGIITTIAGTGVSGYSGDGGAATAAKLNLPYGVAVDSAGNVFIADALNHRIRKVAPTGIISTVAGTGSAGFNGDGIAATSAKLNKPRRVAIGENGSIYIADWDNNRVRKVSSSGIISTVAGNGSAGFGGDGGIATDAILNAPVDIAIDEGILYIADFLNNRVRRVDASGIITTIAGTDFSGYNGDNGAATAAMLNGPSGVAAKKGIVYISDESNNRIRKIDSAGHITTIAGNGTSTGSEGSVSATASSIAYPHGITIGTDDNLYTNNASSNKIIKIVPFTVSVAYPLSICSGDTITLTTDFPEGYWSIGDTTVAKLIDTVHLLGVSGGTTPVFYSAITGPTCETVVTRTLTINPLPDAGTISGSSTLTTGSTTSLSATAPGGTWSSSNTSIATVSSAGVVTGIAAGTATISYTVSNSCGSATATHEVTVIPECAGIITTIAGNGIAGYSGDGGPATGAQMHTPEGIVFDTLGNLYVSEWGTDRIRKIEPGGSITTVLSTTINNPHLIAIDRKNNLYIPDDSHRVWKYNLNTSSLSLFAGNGGTGYSGDGGPATAASFSYPLGAYVDFTGNVYIAGSDARVRKVDTFGNITTIAGNGSATFSGEGGPATATGIGTVWGMTMDNLGNLYIACTDQNAIRKISSSGVISTFAGTGTMGTTGDGGPATAAQLSIPFSINFDAMGTAYVACGNNGNIRRIDIDGVISTIAGNGTYGYSGDGGAATSAACSEIYATQIDASGNLYFSDIWNHCIRKVALTGISISAGSISGGSSLCSGSSITLSDTTSGGTWNSSNTSIVSVDSTGTVTGITPGTAIISYTMTNSCGSASATKVITVNPLPDAGTISGPSSMCIGSTLTLSNAATGGIWSSSDTSIATITGAGGVNGLTAGSLSISYQVSNSCGTATTTKALTVNSLPSGAAANWTAKAPMPIARHNAGVAVVDNIIYVVGGSTATANVNDVQAYDPATDTWTTKTPMDNARAELGVASVNGKIYAMGGYFIGTPTNAVEEYDPTTDTWTTKTPMPTARSIFSVGVINDKIYAVGGWNGHGTNLGTLEVYTPSTDSWETKAPLPIGRNQLNSCAVIDGKLYLIGGKNGTSSAWYADTYVYDTLTDSWSSVANLPYSRFSGAAAVLDGKIHYFGGSIGSFSSPFIPNFNTHAIYDPTTNTWSDGLAMWNKRSIMTAATVNGKIYVMGGVDSAWNTVNWNFEYSPGTSVPTIIVNGTSTVCAGDTVQLSAGVSGGPYSYQWSKDGSNIPGATSSAYSATNNGNYALQVTMAAGCSLSTDSIVVTVNPLPDAGTISGPSIVYTGATITLSNSVSGGSWSSSDSSIVAVSSTGVVTGVASGTVIISYTVSNACGSASATKTITVNASLSTGITGTLMVCTGNTSLLSNATPGGLWSSGNTAVATINASSGLATGVSAGTATISYTVSGSSVTAVLTVNASPTDIGGASAVCVNSTISLSEETPGGTWSSSNAAVAEVNGSGEVTGITAGSVLISYTLSTGCYVTRSIIVNPLPGAITGAGSVCVGGATVWSNSTTGGASWSSSNSAVATVGSSSGVVGGISPGTATITYTLTTGCAVKRIVTVNSAAGTMAGASWVCAGSTTTMTVSAECGTWSSSNTAVATVGSSGVVTGIAAGTIVLTFTTCDGCTATRAMTVYASPAAISGATGFCAGSSGMLTSATPGGNWSSTNTAVATVSASGLVSAVSAGSGTISYALSSGCAATTTITVGSGPSAISGDATVCAGQTTTLSNASDGGTWSSSNASRASVGSSTGVVTGHTMGTAVITYSLSAACYAIQMVTVNGALGAITGTKSMCIAATTTLTNATSGGTWSSANTAIATADPSTGVITGVSAGVTTITYLMSPGCYKTTSVTVNPSPGAIGGTASVCVGSTTALTNSGGVSWTSSNPAVATIAGSGVVSGVSAGTSTITYTLGTGCYTTRDVTVIATPSAITGTTTVCLGNSTTLSSATAGGNWTSSNTTVASVGSASGIVNGLATGTSRISYTASGCVTTSVVTVIALPGSITGAGAVCTGSSATLSCSPAGGTWSSAAATITISSSGLVTGISAGTGVVTYTAPSGCTQTRTVTVNSVPATITGGTSICVGSSIGLSSSTIGGTWSSSNSAVVIGSSTGIATGVSVGTAIISYTVSTGCSSTTVVTVETAPAPISGASVLCASHTITLTHPVSGGAWSSSDAGVATVGIATGVVTGIATGTSRITYNLSSGCNAYKTVTVNSGIAPITGSASVCEGYTTVLTCETGLSWESNNPAVATIGTWSGVVTGISAGTAIMTFTATSTCTNTRVVTVNTTPADITGTLTVCRGSTTTLSCATAGGTWSSSLSSTASVGSATGVVAGNNVGNAMITYTMPTGCYATASVTVNPLPTLPAIVGPGHLHTSSPVTLTASGGAVGTWSSENPARATVVAGPANTTVAQGVTTGGVWITFTVSGSCGSTFRRRHFNVVAPRTGVEANGVTTFIKLYPNPTTGTFTLETAMPGKLEINGIDGRHLASYPVAEPATLVTLPPNLASGVYMCRFEGEDGSSMIVKLVLD